MNPTAENESNKNNPIFNMSPITFKGSTVHIALSTLPLGDEINYIKKIESIYDRFFRRVNSYSEASILDPSFYSSKVYYIFGHYEVAFLSIIESFKFAQDVFEGSYSHNENNTSNGIKNNVSYQILTGAILATNIDDDPIDLSSIYTTYPFIQISTLKLNNGVLIGSGSYFVECVTRKLESIYGKKGNGKYLILNSYNWADLIIILFGKDPNRLSNLIGMTRCLNIYDCLKLKHIDKSEQTIFESNIYEKSLYGDVFGYSKEQIKYSHVFVDTQSHVGIALSEFEKQAANKIKLNTVIEWQTKPGHYGSFKKIIDEWGLFKSVHCKLGKTDYVTVENNSKYLASNYAIYNNIINSNIKHHVRKVNTFPVFPPNENFNINLSDRGILNLPEKIASLKIRDDVLRTFYSNIKKLKLSRQLRMKLRKVFHNYNNGISTISYIFFIDFYPFLVHLLKIVNSRGDKIENVFKKTTSYLKLEELLIKNIEKELESFIEAFEDAYFDRVLNTFNYEDINDLNIDFNSSITQILSMYDTIVKYLSPLFFMPEQQLIFRQNELNTESNIISVNYNVYHLIEPPLVFATIIKEMLNNLDQNLKLYEPISNGINDDREKKLVGHVNKYMNRRDWKEEVISSNLFHGDMYLKSIIENFDAKYFECDVIKYFYTYNAETDLYLFWSWAYFLQNSLHYTKIGYIHIFEFLRELFRIMLIVAAFDKENLHKLKCPIPELYDYWEKGYEKCKKLVLEIVCLDSFKKTVYSLSSIYFNKFMFLKRDDDIGYFEHTLNDIILRFESMLTGQNKIDYYNEINLYSSTPIMEKRLENFSKKTNIEYLQFGNLRWKLLNLFYYNNHLKLENGLPILINQCQPDSLEKKIPSDIFISCMSYISLKWYYKKVDGEIYLLRRNYHTGDVMQGFVDSKVEAFFFIDPHGDFLIPNSENRRICMRFKHAFIYSLWHLSLQLKGDLFELSKKQI